MVQAERGEWLCQLFVLRKAGRFATISIAEYGCGRCQDFSPDPRCRADERRQFAWLASCDGVSCAEGPLHKGRAVAVRFKI